MLFVTWDGGGNVAPLLPIARELVRRGVGVRVLGHPVQRDAVERAGLRFESYREARPWSVLDARAGLRADLAYAAVFADRGIGRDALAALAREPADRVVVDGLLIGGITELQRAGVPVTILVHTLRSIMIRAVTGGPLGAVLRLRGLDPRAAYAAAAGELVVTEPTLDAGAEVAGAGVAYVGPVVPGVVTRRSGAGADRRVLVSLSTTFIRGQGEVLQRAIDGLDAVGVAATVTTGPAVDPAALRPTATTELHAYLPHADAMRRVSAVVGHGGHATTMLALAHGLPLVVVPMNRAFDQPGIAAMVAARGLGVALTPRATAERIGAAALDVLDDVGMRARVDAVARTIGGRDAVTLAADLLTAR